VGEWSHAAFSDDYVWAPAIACSMRCESHEAKSAINDCLSLRSTLICRAVSDGTVSRTAREIREDQRLSVGRGGQVYEAVVVVRTRPGTGASNVPVREDQSHYVAKPASHRRSHRLGQAAAQAH